MQLLQIEVLEMEIESGKEQTFKNEQHWSAEPSVQARW